jgi:hypothetical protein
VSPTYNEDVDPKYIDPTDPRVEVVEHMNMLDSRLFTDSDLARESLNIFSTRIYHTGDTNEDTNCFDPARSYVQNSMGFRGASEFESGVDLIATGCSQTYGLGVDEDATWATSMANALGMTHVTLAAPGWSVQEMTSSVMAYIHKFGKPKVIAALLPDFGRTIFIEHENILISEHGSIKGNDHIDIRVRGFHYDGGYSRARISKAPHVSLDVLPTEAAVYLAAQAWASFIEYCRVGDIKLVWTSWDKHNLDVYSMLQELSEDPGCNRQDVIIDTSGMVWHPYVTYAKAHIEELKKLTCHQEIKDKWPDSFDVGTDACEHYGAHAHAHIGELLTSKYLEIRGTGA